MASARKRFYGYRYQHGILDYKFPDMDDRSSQGEECAECAADKECCRYTGNAEENTCLDLERLGNQEELLDQIGQLQDVVKDMKHSFSLAIDELTRVQFGDQVLEGKVDRNRRENQDQIAGLIQLILAMKNEFTTLTAQVQIAAENQRLLQQQIDCLIFENELLLEELEKNGIISPDTRQKWLREPRRPLTLSSSQSHDSGVALLLERARASINSQHANSDRDSGVTTYQLGDTPSSGPTTPPELSSIQDYVTSIPVSQEDEQYDSDSSLMEAANKSLNLTQSLGQQCIDFDGSTETSEEDESSLDEAQLNTIQALNVSLERRKINPEKEAQRLRVAKEILDTERTYCNCLWILQDTFAEKLRGIVSAKDIKIIFPEEIWRLYEKHCMLLHKIEERMLSWHKHLGIGDIFDRFTDPQMSDVLSLYTNYVSDFPEVLRVLDRCLHHNTRFRNFIKITRDRPPCSGLDLGAFLLTPIQRVPRYVLLLKQMLRFTPSTHPDHACLEMNLERLKGFLTRLNDSIEHSCQLVSAQTSAKIRRKAVNSMTSKHSSFNSYDCKLGNVRDNGIQSDDNRSLRHSPSFIKSMASKLKIARHHFNLQDDPEFSGLKHFLIKKNRSTSELDQLETIELEKALQLHDEYEMNRDYSIQCSNIHGDSEQSPLSQGGEELAELPPDMSPSLDKLDVEQQEKYLGPENDIIVKISPGTEIIRRYNDIESEPRTSKIETYDFQSNRYNCPIENKMYSFENSAPRLPEKVPSFSSDIGLGNEYEEELIVTQIEVKDEDDETRKKKITLVSMNPKATIIGAKSMGNVNEAMMLGLAQDYKELARSEPSLPSSPIRRLSQADSISSSLRNSQTFSSTQYVQLDGPIPCMAPMPNQSCSHRSASGTWIDLQSDIDKISGKKKDKKLKKEKRKSIDKGKPEESKSKKNMALSIRESLRNIFFKKKNNSHRLSNGNANLESYKAENSEHSSCIRDYGVVKARDHCSPGQVHVTFHDENGDPCSTV